MKAGYDCISLHGGIDQYDRDSAVVDFKNGKIKLMIATSVAARGLDVKHLILVVNYDCPNHYEDYVHRCGRTGRAGNKGFAYTFITPDQERISGDIVKALELSETTVPPELQALWDRYKTKQTAVSIPSLILAIPTALRLFNLFTFRKEKLLVRVAVDSQEKDTSLMSRKRWLSTKRKSSRKLL